MKKQSFLLLIACIFTALRVSAIDYTNVPTIKLETPEMKPEMVALPTNPFQSTVSSATASESNTGMDFDFFKSKTAPGVKPYKFMDDMSFVGIPLFLAGWALKSDKAMFRVNNKDGKENTQLLTNFKTGIDDYTQFFGPAMVVGLKLGGYEGRSDWPRLLASAAMSYGIMAAFVNGIKYTAKEMRPDGTSANSWPSGHTATAFVGATLLHKEYGLTRSPWWSVAGYGVATATGVMRVLNNRHWVSDVMSGAGIGILSTELGYALSDVFFKGKGLLHNDLQMDFENPSFFSIGMGAGLGGKSIDFSLQDLENADKYKDYYYADDDVEDEYGSMGVEFRAATVVDAEGAYFFNKYVGIGGRFRVRAMSAKTFGQYTGDLTEDSNYAWDMISDIYGYNPEYYMEESYPLSQKLTPEQINKGGKAIEEIGAVVESDHLTEFTASAGIYLNLPLSKRFSLGTKFLLGRSFTQELDIDGYAKGKVKDIQYDMHIVNGQPAFNKDKQLAAGGIDDPTNTPNNDEYDLHWDMLTIGAKSSTSFGTGLSLTYRYKSNFSWRLYFDYDYTEKDFTMKYDPYHYLKSSLTDTAYSLVQNKDLSELSLYLDPVQYKKTKKMNYFTIGLAFLVNF
jgi:membrane-associated phospholipid phosphatase